MTGDGAGADLAGEARRFGAYLLGKEVPEATVTLYVAAMEAMDLEFDERDRRVLAHLDRHPWSIGVVDAGLALRRPSSAVRTKLLTMSAILESTPELSDVFLPTPRHRLYLGYAAFVGFRAVAKAAIGLAMLVWI